MEHVTENGDRGDTGEDHSQEKRDRPAMSQNFATATVGDRVGLYVGILALVCSSISLTIVLTKWGDLKDETIKQETEERLINDWMAQNHIVLERGRYVVKQDQ